MEKIPEQNPIDIIHDEITHARERIEEEYARGNNPWAACVISRLTVISGYLEIAEEDGNISKEDATEAKGKINLAIGHIRGLQSRYSSPEDIVPEDEKNTVIELLAIL